MEQPEYKNEETRMRGARRKKVHDPVGVAHLLNTNTAAVQKIPIEKV